MEANVNKWGFTDEHGNPHIILRDGRIDDKTGKLTGTYSYNTVAATSGQLDKDSENANMEYAKKSFLKKNPDVNKRLLVDYKDVIKRQQVEYPASPPPSALDAASEYVKTLFTSLLGADQPAADSLPEQAWPRNSIPSPAMKPVMDRLRNFENDNTFNTPVRYVYDQPKGDPRRLGEYNSTQDIVSKVLQSGKTLHQPPGYINLYKEGITGKQDTLPHELLHSYAEKTDWGKKLTPQEHEMFANMMLAYTANTPEELKAAMGGYQSSMHLPESLMGNKFATDYQALLPFIQQVFIRSTQEPYVSPMHEVLKGLPVDETNNVSHMLETLKPYTANYDDL